MIRYVLKQCKNQLAKIYGKWFAYPVIEETVNLDGLSEHMSNHNSPFSKGVIKGLLTDMVNCIKELLLEGKNVKIDDLAIFSIGIKNAKGGAEKEEDFSVTKNISSVKLRSRATGILLAKALNLEATLKKATALTGGQTTGTGGESGEEPSNENSGD
jgi:predicted histone-like DNA-binding protein